MEKIKQEINEFLDSCLKSQQEFLNKLNSLKQEADSFKYKTVSKYHITQSGIETLNQRIRKTFLARLRQLKIDYVTRLETLQVEYDEMMKDHRQLNDDWKEKKEQFPLWYAQLVKNVLTEKKDFCTKIEQNCSEIQEAADVLLNRLLSLYSEEEIKENEGIKENKTFLEERVQETADIWMTSIMFYTDISH